MIVPEDSSSVVSRILFRPDHPVPVSLDSLISTSPVEDSFLYNFTTTATTPYDLDSLSNERGLASIVIKVDSPSSNHHQIPGAGPSGGSEDALLNRSSVLFVAVSFILLMVISLAWLVFYYIQRFRYLHSKERVTRRLAELAKKAVARIPVKTLNSRDKEINLEHEKCAICIEQFRPLDTVRILPCRHYFHKLCIDPWLLEQRSCPMCKLDILQAYGMRTDGFCGYPRQDNSIGVVRHDSDGGTAEATVSGTNHPAAASGPASASGSDDGMVLERIALVHPTPTPTLTYVVLTTTTSVASAHPPRPAVPTAGTIYYVHNSDTSISTNTSPTTSTVLPSDCSHTIIPLTNPIFVSVLPPGCAATSQPSSTTPAVLSQEPPPPSMGGGLVLWNHPSSQCGSTGHVHSPPATCLSWSLSCQQPLSSCHSDQSKPITTNKATCDITHTTQTFTGPVCSVMTDDISADQNILLREPLITATSHASFGQPSSHSIDSVYLISHDPSNVVRQPFEQIAATPTLSLTYMTPTRHAATSHTGLLNKLTHPLLTRVNRRSAFFSWFPARFRRRTTTVCQSISAPPPSSSPYTHSFLPPDRIVSHTRDDIVRTSISSIPVRSLDVPDSPPVGSQSVVVAVVETFPSPSDSPDERYEALASHNLPEL